MKRILGILCVLFIALSVGACAPNNEATNDGNKQVVDDWTYIKDKGELIIGITSYEPMNYEDKDGKLIGFDTEYAEAVCAKLGIEPKFIFINWDTKEIELKSKNIDCIWNGLTISEERRGNMDFTQPYLVNEQVIIVRSADLDKYKDKADFKGVNVVAESGSAGQDAIESDLSDAIFIAVDAQTKALLEVKAGTAQAAVVDATLAKSMTGSGTDYTDLAVIDSLNLTSEEYAIGLRLDSTAVAEFNKVTQELQQEGIIGEIAEKYGLTERLID